MINLLNKKIKVYLVNSLAAEGIVTHQDERIIELSNEKIGSKLYINNPINNIIMYIVYAEEKSSSLDDNLIQEQSNQDDKIKSLLKKKLLKEDSTEAIDENLNSLYIEKNELEKEIIRKKLFNPNINSQEQVYGTISQLNDFNISKKASI